MMRKRSKAMFTAGIVGASVLAFAGAAEAHTASASMTCQGGLVIDAALFPSSGNDMFAAFDGVSIGHRPFGTSLHAVVANPDKTKPHTWQVLIVAGDGAQNNKNFTGSVAACETAPTTTTAAPTTTTVAVTTTTQPAPTTTVVADATTTVAPAVTDPLPTVVVSPSLPVPPTVAIPPDVTLPRTGASDAAWSISAAGLLFVFAGAAMIWATRRHPRSSR